MQAAGQHALDSNPGPLCCKTTVLTTATLYRQKDDGKKDVHGSTLLSS